MLLIELLLQLRNQVLAQRKLLQHLQLSLLQKHLQLKLLNQVLQDQERFTIQLNL